MTKPVAPFDWEAVVAAVDDPHMPLPDIVVDGAMDAHGWQRVFDALAARFAVSATVDGQELQQPLQVGDLFTKPEFAALVVIQGQFLRINGFFTTPDAAFFDISSLELASRASVGELIDFLRALNQSAGCPVHVYPEGGLNVDSSPGIVCNGDLLEVRVWPHPPGGPSFVRTMRLA